MGVIDTRKLDTVARFGGHWYSRASGASLFQIPKPLRTLGIGIDQMPEEVRNSTILSGNNLGRLGNVEAFPSEAAVEEFGQSADIQEMRVRFQPYQDSMLDTLHFLPKEALDEDYVDRPLLILLQPDFCEQFH